MTEIEKIERATDALIENCWDILRALLGLEER
jgi:hypothetical protein